MRLLPAVSACLVLSSLSAAKPSAEPGTRTAAAPEAHLGPPPAREVADLRVAVISDLNSSYGSTHYLPAVGAATDALLDRIRPELVLITGDMVAGQRRGLRYAEMWRAFHELVTTPLARSGVLVAPTPGNHDASPFAAFAPERSEYVRQWSERAPAVSFVDRSGYPLRYSFTYRGAWFLGLDAARSGPLGREQRDWVRVQLEAARDYPVKIVFGHLPVYPTAAERVLEVIADPELEQLFADNHVSLYVSGHHHAYYPGAAGAVRHVSMPCLGAGARPLLGTTRASPQALVVLDIQEDRVRSVEALRAPDFEASIARADLPASVGHGGRRLSRDDLSGFTSTPVPLRGDARR